MTRRNEDDVLRKEFQRLRTERAASGRTPDFQAMLARAKAEAATTPDLGVVEGKLADARSGTRHQRLWRVGGWVSAALAAGVAAVLLVGGGAEGDEEFESLVASYLADAGAGAWRSPTSSLLEVPGIGYTRSVPAVGEAVRGLDRDALPGASDPERRDS